MLEPSLSTNSLVAVNKLTPFGCPNSLSVTCTGVSLSGSKLTKGIVRMNMALPHSSTVCDIHVVCADVCIAI